MKDLMRIIKADWNNGIWHNKTRFIVPFVISVIVCNNFLNKLYSYLSYKGVSERASLLECLMYVFRGMKEFIPGEDQLFELPIVFVVLNLYLAYLIGDYAVGDIQGYGLQMLLKTGSKIKWWMSKCIWNFVTVILFYLTVFMGTACVWLIYEKANGSLIEMDTTILGYIFEKKMGGLAFQSIVIFFLVMVLTSVSISLCQMALSLYIKPMASFLAVAVLYVVSGYYMSSLLPGNYMMLIRCDGVDVRYGLCINIVMIVVSTVCGYLCFRKRNLI